MNYLEQREIWEQTHARLFLYNKYLKNYEITIKEDTAFSKEYVKYTLNIISTFKQRFLTKLFNDTSCE